MNFGSYYGGPLTGGRFNPLSGGFGMLGPETGALGAAGDNPMGGLLGGGIGAMGNAKKAPNPLTAQRLGGGLASIGSGLMNYSKEMDEMHAARRLSPQMPMPPMQRPMQPLGGMAFGRRFGAY